MIERGGYEVAVDDAEQREGALQTFQVAAAVTAYGINGGRDLHDELLQVDNALLGENLDDDTLIVSTSGRYEFRNKGIDVFV